MNPTPNPSRYRCKRSLKELAGVIGFLRSVVFVAVIAATFILSWGCRLDRALLFSPHYSDDQMKAHFQDHKSDFESLVQMFESDSEVFSVCSFCENPVRDRDLQAIEISSARTDRYFELMKRIGVEEIERTYQGKDFIILSYTTHISPHDGDGVVTKTSKGFAYSPTVPDSPQFGERSVTTKKIAEGWYIRSTERRGVMD